MRATYREGPDSLKSRDQERALRIRRLGYDYASKAKLARTNCNLCGHKDFLTITELDRYSYPAPAALCLRCGLVFLNPVMTAIAYREFYADVYRPLVSAYHGRLINAETIQAEQVVYAEALERLLRPFVQTRGLKTMLDIGGSTGVVAAYLAKRFGLEATIIDPSPLEAIEAKRLGVNVIEGLVEDWDPQGSTFDLILMCQTIDHLLDISATLEKTRALLPLGGLFFVDIVDFRAAYLYHGSIKEAVKIDHPYSLTEPTVETYLARAGMEILSRRNASDSLHVEYVTSRGLPRSHALTPQPWVRDLLREISSVQRTRG